MMLAAVRPPFNFGAGGQVGKIREQRLAHPLSNLLDQSSVRILQIVRIREIAHLAVSVRNEIVAVDAEKLLQAFDGATRQRIGIGDGHRTGPALAALLREGRGRGEENRHET